MNARERAQKAMNDLMVKQHPYKKPVQDMIGRLKRAGFKPQWVDDDDDRYREDLVRHILSVDECWLKVELNNERFTLFIVLGNSPSEIVADYSCNDSRESAELDKVIDDFSDYWLGI